MDSAAIAYNVKGENVSIDSWEGFSFLTCRNFSNYNWFMALHFHLITVRHYRMVNSSKRLDPFSCKTKSNCVLRARFALVVLVVYLPTWLCYFDRYEDIMYQKRSCAVHSEFFIFRVRIVRFFLKQKTKFVHFLTDLVET